MGPMASRKNPSNSARIGQILASTAVAVGGTVASIYVVNRLRRHRQTQALLDTLPPSTDATIKDETAEPADDTYDPAEVNNAVAADLSIEVASDESLPEPLEALTVEELYQLARKHDIAGRSSMRKAGLIVALRDAQPES